MANCPLCSDVLLRHVRSGETYWFCRCCRIEILDKTTSTNGRDRINLQPTSVQAISTSPRPPLTKSGEVMIQPTFNSERVDQLIR
ncbi:hypothetical protein [Leptothermofonsia sp. ETS-13]|uniref:hypothetical protein n=1 Tax=Leptothermofonsia sp. ETS-13 TaxID=3035696 RepID=UPI003B9E46E8